MMQDKDYYLKDSANREMLANIAADFVQGIPAESMESEWQKQWGKYFCGITLQELGITEKQKFNIMDAAGFAAAMQNAIKESGGDIERQHAECDAIMCELLTMLGYGDGVKIFDDSERWYA